MSLYFERMFWWHYPIVILAAFLKWKVFAFDVDLKMKQKRGMRFFLSKGWVERIVAHHYPFGDSHTKAIDAAECVVNLMHQNIVIKSMIRMYNDDEVLLVFKRSLAEKLAVLFSMQYYFWVNKQATCVYLVPSSYCAYMGLLKSHSIESSFPSDVQLVGHGYVGRFLSYIYGLVHYFIVIVIYSMHFSTQSLHKKKIDRQQFKYGISLAAAWFEKFKGGPREFTFLVDDKLISKKESVFLIEYPNTEGFFQSYKKKGFSLFPVLAPKKIKHIFERNALSACAELRNIPVLLSQIYNETFIRESVMTLLVVRMTWGRALSKLYFDHYIYSNKENKNQIALNIFLRAYGVSSWSYSQFIGGPYQVDSPKTPFDNKNVYWSFLNSDYSMLNCEAMASSMKRHHQVVREYQVIGNIFSEMIKTMDKKSTRKKLLKNAKNLDAEDKKWVAVFDTSYADIGHTYSNFEEASSFLEDIIRLAVTHNNLLFFFKPSKDDAYFIGSLQAWSSPSKGEIIVNLRKQLLVLNNVVMLDDFTDPVEVIAASDVVVTHCFSSPTADALSAGIPAFWYESGELTRDYPLDQVCGLVAHGYDELNLFLNNAFAGCFVKNLYNQKLFREMVNLSEGTHALTDLRSSIKAVGLTVYE